MFTSSSSVPIHLIFSPPFQDDGPTSPSLGVSGSRKRPHHSTADGSSGGNGTGSGGAIIESMHHHGKGVYSGTFSGKCCSKCDNNNQREHQV